MKHIHTHTHTQMSMLRFKKGESPVLQVTVCQKKRKGREGREEGEKKRAHERKRKRETSFA